MSFGSLHGIRHEHGNRQGAHSTGNGGIGGGFFEHIEGMDVADALNAEYGEKAGGGIRGGRQDPLFKEGNALLRREFPRLDYITRASIVPD